MYKRQIVACAEESERFGIGVFEDSAVIASHAGTRLEASGLRGFALVEIDPTTLVLQHDSFIARGVRLTVLAPGDSVDLETGELARAGAPEAPAALLAGLLAGLAGDGAREGRGLALATRQVDSATAVLDLECPRDDRD